MQKLHLTNGQRPSTTSIIRVLPLTGLAFFLAAFIFSSISIATASSYQKIAPGDTVTLGEFVFDDDFTPTTTPCTIGITNPSGTEVVPSTTPMSANADGWHYYDYTTAGNAPSGVWPSIMICGSVATGDLVIVDKSFVVDWSVVSTSSIQDLIDDGWTVTLSDFEGTTVSTAYKAKLQVLNYATIPTDADAVPTITITDPVGTVQVSSASMIEDSDGTYSYSYSIGASSIGGVWETVVSTIINGETILSTDYWNLSSSPADVQIIEMTDTTIPFITANVRIDNMGTVGSDFYYVYCIVDSAENLCGGGNDIDSASDTSYINAGSFINLFLTLDNVPSPGTYWFKIRARALAETLWAASTEQFIADSGTVTPPPGGGGGGGGGSVPPPSGGACTGADFNHNGIVNSVDFSILLFFWDSKAPFSNPCVDINKDLLVNSVDFSILLYQWGGPGVNIN